MGYASRASHVVWYSVYTATWRQRIGVALRTLRYPSRVRSLRGHMWSWLRGHRIPSLRTLSLPVTVRTPAPMSEQERDLRACAAHLRDEPHMLDVVNGLDVGEAQKAQIRRELSGILRERRVRHT